MSAGENARRENRELARTSPMWAQRLRPALIAHHRLRRFLGGMYSQAPFSYDIYTKASPDRRQRHSVKGSRIFGAGRSVWCTRRLPSYSGG